MNLFRDVVFDLGGVLVDWNPRHLFISRRGENRAAVDEFLRTVCTPQWHASLDGGEHFAPAARALAEKFPAHVEWITAYVTEWESMFAGPIASAVQQLERCVDRGLRLHALTNYPPEKIAFLYSRFPFMREFYMVVVSGLLGRMKPDARVFEYLVERVGTRECLFVDDRIENVRAARDSGLHALHFDPVEGSERLAALIDSNGLVSDMR